jgi:hypothetical protein
MALIADHAKPLELLKEAVRGISRARAEESADFQLDWPVRNPAEMHQGSGDDQDKSISRSHRQPIAHARCEATEALDRDNPWV